MKTDKNYKKGEMITVDITDFGENGEGIGKTDAFTWFIKDTVIGDKVIAKVMKTKKSYGYARLDSIVTESPDRVRAKCPVARSCGGCTLQSLDYRAELRIKQNKVENHLKRIGGFDLSNVEIEEIIGMEEPYRYRNKSQFPFGRKNGKNITGYFAGRTHSIVEFDDCIIGIEENKTVLKTVLEFMEKYRVDAYNEEDTSGIIRHVLIRKGFATGELMVCVVINADNLVYSRELVESLCTALGKDLQSVSLNINKKNTNVILGDRTITIYGREYIEDYIGDVKFRISPQSFYQVNPVQTKKLYGKALEYAALTGEETVWDMYCGIGTISLFLAKSAKFVYGVEIVDAAIQNARENAKLNNIENVKFFVGKAEEIITDEYENGNIKDIDVNYLLSNISYVFQDIFMLTDTIFENIKMGLNKTKEEVYQAAKDAEIHEFIMSLPNGYDTIIGDGYIKLSGGEKQRISIARCLLKNSPIVVLDEITAYSDIENEAKIQSAIRNLLKDKTAIIIAHRLYTIKDVDNIVVLNEGEIVESGKHQDLITKENGLYKHLWEVK
mgnify:CR=1 FL=1